MKRLSTLLISSFILFANSASAQILLYGNAGLDRLKGVEKSSYPGSENSTPSLAWHISPGIGYTLKCNVTIGLQGGFAYINNLIPSSYLTYTGGGTLPTYALRSWSVGVFGRYTKKLGEHFFFYTQADISHFQSSYKQNGAPTTGTFYNTTTMDTHPEGNGTTMAVFPGFGINLYHGLGIQANIGGISYTIFNYPDGFSTHHTAISLGQQFNFGVYKSFARHKPAAGKNAAILE